MNGAGRNQSPIQGKNKSDYLIETRNWLNLRFDLFDSDGIYVPNQPVYSFSAAAFRLEEYARSFAILNILSRIRFRSFLDVGCADGYFPDLVRRLYTADVLGADLSDRALVRARQMFGISGCSVDAHALPFPTDSFDVVNASEVLEHVVDPGEVISELQRVARRFVIISTPRAGDAAAVQRHFDTLDSGEPHAHIHYFTDTAMRNLAGPRAVLFGARSKFTARLYNALAWADDTSLNQRRAYLDFTLKTTQISPASRASLQDALIHRYTVSRKWKKQLMSPRTMRYLLKLDVFLANRFRKFALDHLVLIPCSETGPGRPAVSSDQICRVLLHTHSAPLRQEKK